MPARDLDSLGRKDPPGGLKIEIRFHGEEKSEKNVRAYLRLHALYDTKAKSLGQKPVRVRGAGCQV